jgi:pilus assembly protein Flp/PilA
MAQFITYLQALVGRKDEKGAAMVEYGILVAGIAVLVMVAVFALGGQIDGLFNDVVDQLNGP